MPRWKSARENFSLGLCVLSSSRPQPSSSVSTPSRSRKVVDDRDRAPFADEDRRRAEALLDRPRGGCDVRTVERHDDARARRGSRSAPSRCPAGSGLSRNCFSAAAIFCGILVRHQAEAELRAGSRRQHRLGRLRPGSRSQRPLMSNVGRAQRRSSVVKPSSPASRSTPSLLLELRLRRTAARRTAARSASVSGSDVVVEAGHLDAAVGRRSARRASWQSALAGLVTAPPNVPECRSCFGPVSRSSK